MKQMRRDIPRPPTRMRRLPQDSAGRPVPYFVAWVDGKPDFRVMDGKKRVRAHVDKLCFTCGQPLLKHLKTQSPAGTFVVGPMCVVNLVSAEPPSHHDCAVWSAQACPFLTNADKDRRRSNMPEGAENPAGIMIERNPGVCALVESHRWFVMPDDHGGMLFRFRAEAVTWMAGGRTATTGQIMESMETGIMALVDMCAGEENDLNALAVQTNRALRTVPGLSNIDPYPNVRRALGV